MWLQWLIALFVRGRSKRGLRAGAPGTIPIDAVGRVAFRVLLTDIDLLGHMNNGRYLSYMDLARVDLTRRAGMEASLTRKGIYAVVGQQTIAYRTSLELWQRFEIETRFVGADDRSLYLEQRFVVGGEVCARAIVRGRFIQKGAGSVKIDAVSAACGYDFAAHPVPEHIREWATRSALPPGRAAAPSVWP